MNLQYTSTFYRSGWMAITVILLLVATSCNPNYDMAGMFCGSSPNTDERFAASMQWTDAHEPLSFMVEDTYRIYVGTDSHVDSTSRNVETFMRTYRADTLAPFAIHLGDLVNANGNYPRFDQAIRAIPEGYVRPRYDTLLITAGNHDIYFGQWKEFLQYYKTSTYWFETRSRKTGKPLDMFITLDSSSGALGRKQIAWLRQLLEQRSKVGYRHIVVYTHTHIFKQDNTQGHTSNYPMEETYELAGLFHQYHVDMVWMGHDHSREISSYGETTYIIVDTMQDPEQAFYMIATMGDKIACDFVEF